MKPLAWREHVVIRILIIVAQIVNEDDVVRNSLTSLHNHISCGPREK